MKIPSEIISQLGSYRESDRGLGSPLQQMIQRRLTRPLSLHVLNHLVCFIHVFFYTNTELVLLAKGFLLQPWPGPIRVEFIRGLLYIKLNNVCYLITQKRLFVLDFTDCISFTWRWLISG